MNKKGLFHLNTFLLAAAAAGGIVALIWNIKRIRAKKSFQDLRQLYDKSQLSNLKKSLVQFSDSFLSCSLHQMPKIHILFETLFSKYLSILQTNTSSPSLNKTCTAKNIHSYYSCVDCSAAWNNESHFSQKLLSKNALTPLNRICEDCFDSRWHVGHCVQKHISISQENCDCRRTSILSKEFNCSKHQDSHQDCQHNDKQESQRELNSFNNNSMLVSFFETMIGLCINSEVQKNDETDKSNEKINKTNSLLTGVLDKILEILNIDVENYAVIFKEVFTSIVNPKGNHKNKSKKPSQFPDTLLKMIIKQSQHLGNENELKLKEIFSIISDQSPEFAEAVFILTTTMREKYLLRRKQGKIFDAQVEYYSESVLVGICSDYLWRESIKSSKNIKDMPNSSSGYLLEPLNWMKQDLMMNKGIELFQEIKCYESQLRIAQQIALFSSLDTIDDQMLATFQVMQQIDEISRFEFYSDKDVDYFFENNALKLLIVQLLDLCDSYLTTNLAILIKRQKSIPIIIDKTQEKIESSSNLDNITINRPEKNQGALNGIYKLEKAYRNHVKDLSKQLHKSNLQYATVSLSSTAELSMPFLLMLSSFEFTQNSLRSLFSQPKSKEIILNMEYILRSYMPSSRQIEFQTLILRSIESSQTSPLHGMLEQFEGSFLQPIYPSVLSLSRYHRLILSHQITSLALLPERIDSCSFTQTFIHLTNQLVSPEGSSNLPSLYLSLAIMIDSQPFENFTNIFFTKNEQIEEKFDNQSKDKLILQQTRTLQEKVRSLIGQEVSMFDLIEIAELLLSIEISPFSCNFICEIRKNLFLSQLNSNIMKHWLDNYEECTHSTALACYFILIYQTISYELSEEIINQPPIFNPWDLCYSIFFSDNAKQTILQAFDAKYASQDREVKIFKDLINLVQKVCDRANSLKGSFERKEQKSCLN